jgi:predicted N-acetyltransferase YhbS
MTHFSSKPTATAVQTPAFKLLPESEEYAADILNLHEAAFGPGRFTRAAFRLREQGPFDQSVSFMALDNQTQQLLGSARLTWVKTGGSKSCGLLLGPLAVQPNVQNVGIGRALVRRCLEAAGATNAQFVMLVGDQPYYGPLGFETAPIGQVKMPGPVDEKRLLVCPLGGFDIKTMIGKVCHSDLICG